MAVVAAAYVLPFPYFPDLNNPNENVRFYMTAALVEQGTYCIDGPWARWGWVNDAARTADGRRFSVKAPGASWLAVPGYALYNLLPGETDRRAALWVCRMTASVLPTLAFLWVLYGWLCRRHEAAARDRPALLHAAFLSLALGSNFYAYGQLFVSHTVAGACGFGAFMLLSDRRAPALAGFLAAAVTALEYPGLVVSCVLTAYAATVLPRRALAAYAAGALLPALAVMHFHASAFGNPLTPGHRWLDNPAFRALARQGLYGAAAAPQPVALRGLTLDPGYGLLPMTPLLAAAVLPTKERGGAFALAAALLLLLAISCMNNWRGGWTVGPRYLTPVLPFLAWRALAALSRLADPPRRWLPPRLVDAAALAALAAALLLSGVPSAWYPHVPPEVAHPLPYLWSHRQEWALPWTPPALLGAAWVLAARHAVRSRA